MLSFPGNHVVNVATGVLSTCVICCSTHDMVLDVMVQEVPGAARCHGLSVRSGHMLIVTDDWPKLVSNPSAMTEGGRKEGEREKRERAERERQRERDRGRQRERPTETETDRDRDRD